MKKFVVEDAKENEIARREFVRLAAMTAAFATACTRAPSGELHPLVKGAPETAPGEARTYATANVHDGYAIGIVAESHDGRPTKIEGNPDHPASLGATSAIDQATILSLYDPDRAKSVMRRGGAIDWLDFADAMRSNVHDDGAGTFIVMHATSSPTVADQVARLRAKYPRIDVRWSAPLANVAAWSGAQIAFGAALERRLDLHRADVVVALDDDFLASGPSWIPDARAWADRRRLASAHDEMNRLYVAEPTMTVTGMSADHRRRVKRSDVPAVAVALAHALVANGIAIDPRIVDRLAPWNEAAKAHATWASSVAHDLATHRDRALVVVGHAQPAPLHALVHAINETLQITPDRETGLVTFAPSPIIDAGADAFDLAPLSRALAENKVETLIVVGTNLAYSGFADHDWQHLLAKAKSSFYVGAYVDETAAACEWFAPHAHVLESWSDARGVDGTASLIQPLALPMHDGKTPADLLALLLDDHASPRGRLLSHWMPSNVDTDEWSTWLARGVIPNTSFARQDARVRIDAVANALATFTPATSNDAIEITLDRDTKVHDGSHANNAWLMELPDPVTRLTWGCAARMSAETARALDLRDGQVVRVETSHASIELPALIAPGHADSSIAIALGYGRSGSGESIARGVGANAFALRTSTAPWSVASARVIKTDRDEVLALEQLHGSLEGRDDDILIHRTLAEHRALKKDLPKSIRHLSLYEAKPGDSPKQWGMVIDLNACTGCASCVVACQSENNIPVVGKLGIAKGRTMHWLRIDRYFSGNEADPRTLLEPMLCQHCEKAPCEYVCPVNATTHSSDGLNQMVYNRCVGTRFCSNNCPYKVRRFNWFDYHQDEAASLAGSRNPDVTVRARGVMEKCTYCVQRIRESAIREDVTGHHVGDGAVVTACQQACPTRAITFGDIADPNSRVTKLRADDRRFEVLGDLGTAPRTQYLARVTNPNPDIT
jgi:Fe-S-cluster-containing dehydrogenase component